MYAFTRNDNLAAAQVRRSDAFSYINTHFSPTNNNLAKCRLQWFLSESTINNVQLNFDYNIIDRDTSPAAYAVRQPSKSRSYHRDLSVSMNNISNLFFDSWANSKYYLSCDYMCPLQSHTSANIHFELFVSFYVFHTLKFTIIKTN